MPNPVVDIIIPTYNGSRWLQESIDSALAQTYPACEVLVVDDGSTDGTEDLVQRYYSDLVQYVRKPNGGLSSARNLALSMTSGEFVQFLDADDLILPEKVATHVEFMEGHPEVAVVYCHSECFLDGNISERFNWDREPYYRSGDVLADMISNTFMLTHAALSRRDWIERTGPFDEDLTSAVDGDFWLRMARIGAQFHYLAGKPMTLYRIRSDSQSANSVGTRRNMLRVLTKLEASIPDRGERRRLKIQRAKGEWQARYGFALMESGEVRRGWTELAKSMVKDRRQAPSKLSRMFLVPLIGWRKTGVLLDGLKRVRRLTSPSVRRA